MAALRGDISFRYLKQFFLVIIGIIIIIITVMRGCRGHDRMVVGFTIICEISAYRH